MLHSDDCVRVVCIWKAISDKASSRRHDIHRDYLGHGAEELLQSDQSTLIGLVMPMIGAGLHTALNMRDNPPRDFLYNLRPPSPSATVLCAAGNARGAQIDVSICSYCLSAAYRSTCEVDICEKEHIRTHRARSSGYVALVMLVMDTVNKIEQSLTIERSCYDPARHA